MLGYHGCDRDVAETLLAGTPFNVSENEWAWLGTGVCFWEANPLRGLEFAEEWRLRGKIASPYVIGAVIDLGICLDMLTSTGTRAVAAAHADFLAYCMEAGVDMPTNTLGADRVLRALDCAVVNHTHKVRDALKLTPFDTVKGAFVEGGPLYEGSGFFQKSHIQACVRTLSCIKGVFRVPDDQLTP